MFFSQLKWLSGDWMLKDKKMKYISGTDLIRASFKHKHRNGKFDNGIMTTSIYLFASYCSLYLYLHLYKVSVLKII